MTCESFTPQTVGDCRPNRWSMARCSKMVVSSTFARSPSLWRCLNFNVNATRQMNVYTAPEVGFFCAGFWFRFTPFVLLQQLGAPVVLALLHQNSFDLRRSTMTMVNGNVHGNQLPQWSHGNSNESLKLVTISRITREQTQTIIAGSCRLAERSNTVV